MTYGAQSETSELRKNISLVPEKMANAAEEKLCLRSKISPVKSPKKLKKIQSEVPKMIVETIYQ